MKIRSHFIWLAIAASTAMGFGQSPAAPPKLHGSAVPVKRLPAAQSIPQMPPLLQKYDFGGQLRLLEDPMAMDQRDFPNPAVPSAAPATANNNVPKNYQPRTDLPLSPTALEAVHVSETWHAEQNTPASDKDGRVLYAYGAGLPVVVCAPLRICTIELQPGEKITSEPQIGDSVRWNISPATYGQGEQTTSVIVLKPQEPGLDTNLLITTDRRAYYLRLVSKPKDYVARLAFSYPEDENNGKWRQHLLAQRAQALQEERDARLIPAMVTADKLNFNYKISGGNEQIRPVRVFDDGAKTYIQMRPDIQSREAPALLVLGPDGKGEMTNYRIQRQTYIVDRLFDRARLVLGVGKKAEKVEITREQQPKG